MYVLFMHSMHNNLFQGVKFPFYQNTQFKEAKSQ